MRKIQSTIILPAVFFLAGAGALSAGQLSLGGEFLTWTTNYTSPFNGTEFWAPLSLNFNVDKDINVYGQTEFGSGSYTDSFSGTETINLTDFSDTVLGGEFTFQSFGLPSMLNIGLNLPTGDPTWETKQINSNIPIEFVDSRYRGRGFGADVLYGWSLPAGGGEFGAAVGYLYGGAFNPSYGGAPITQLKMGDSAFLSLNHVQPYSDNQSEIIRLSAYYSLPTQNGSQNLYQLGTNLNASYSWLNPLAFSFEAGVQYWLPGQVTNLAGNWVPEPNAYYGPRFYLDPKYAFGDFSLAGHLKYILTNGYSQTDSSYFGGGFLGGLQPSYNLKLDGTSGLNVYAEYDYVAWFNGASDQTGNLTNVIYNLWTFGATYQLKL